MRLKARAYYRTSPVIIFALMLVILIGLGAALFTDMTATRKVTILAASVVVGAILAFWNRVAKEIYFGRLETRLRTEGQTMPALKKLLREERSGRKYSVAAANDAELKALIRENKKAEKEGDA